ncbi:MAG: hypothetical protein JW969_19530 [Spirochaetales bacterium]|nr:hypothetical protein [Spirochaetales bacterium]
MKNYLELVKQIESFSGKLGGVFTLSDLMTLLNIGESIAFYRLVKKLENDKVIRRFLKGYYVTEGYGLEILSRKICPESYISFDNVLARELLIGTIPQNRVLAVKKGKKREYRFEDTLIRHVGITPHLYFGYYTDKGINFADKEKALLDVLYFYIKGMKFYFDIFSDIDLEKIDMKKMENYLVHYRNPKFVQFVRRFFDDNKISR